MENVFGLCQRPLKRFQQPKQSEKGPRWVKDKAVFWCKHCNTDFSVVVRKHHCRHCGHIFCSHCCNNKRTLIKFGYLKPVRLCNKCNANCFKADLLLNAVGLNDLNTVKKICEEGCDVHFTTTIFPALTIAANRGSSDMVRLLLRYGADVNHAVPATDSGTVVQCSRCGRTQAAGTIKDNQYECTYCGNFTRHADASDSDHTGITALHAAVQKEGHLDVVVALLEHGANVDSMTAKGNTPLMYACAGGHEECAGVLLEYGAAPSIKSEADMDTPLHKAVREGHIDIVNLLLRHKADVSASNVAGLTAQQLAERCKRADIAAVLAAGPVEDAEISAPKVAIYSGGLNFYQDAKPAEDEVEPEAEGEAHGECEHHRHHEHGFDHDEPEGGEDAVDDDDDHDHVCGGEFEATDAGVNFVNITSEDVRIQEQRAEELVDRLEREEQEGKGEDAETEVIPDVDHTHQDEAGEEEAGEVAPEETAEETAVDEAEDGGAAVAEEDTNQDGLVFKKKKNKKKR